MPVAKLFDGPRAGEEVEGDPYQALLVLLPNRLEHELQTMATKRLTAGEFFGLAPGLPVPEEPESPGARFIFMNRQTRFLRSNQALPLGALLKSAPRLGFRRGDFRGG